MPTQLGSISLSIKSAKPPISFALDGVSPADSVLSIKERLASEHSRAPSADIQRLLLKGKVLADGKLLKEYLPDSTESSVALSLMIKPGASWAAEEKIVVDEPSPSSELHIATGGASLAAPTTGVARKAHVRTASEGAADQFPVPSLVLSTPGSPTAESPGRRSPVPLEIADPSMDPESVGSLTRPRSPSSTSGIGIVITRPQFWTRLREFLEGEVALTEGVSGSTRATEIADELFETFLLASKNHLSPSEIAMIRDAVNITGMSGA